MAGVADHALRELLLVRAQHAQVGLADLRRVGGGALQQHDLVDEARHQLERRAHGLHLGHAGREDERLALARGVLQQREVGEVGRSHLVEGAAHAVEEVHAVLVPARREEEDADLVGVLLHLVPLGLAQLERVLVLAVGGAERVLVHVRLHQALLGEDALHGALLELDGVAAHVLGHLDQLLGDLHVALVVDAGLADHEALVGAAHAHAGGDLELVGLEGRDLGAEVPVLGSELLHDLQVDLAVDLLIGVLGHLVVGNLAAEARASVLERGRTREVERAVLNELALPVLAAGALGGVVVQRLARLVPVEAVRAHDGHERVRLLLLELGDRVGEVGGLRERRGRLDHADDIKLVLVGAHEILEQGLGRGRVRRGCGGAHVHLGTRRLGEARAARQVQQRGVRGELRVSTGSGRSGAVVQGAPDRSGGQGRADLRLKGAAAVDTAKRTRARWTQAGRSRR